MSKARMSLILMLSFFLWACSSEKEGQDTKQPPVDTKENVSAEVFEVIPTDTTEGQLTDQIEVKKGNGDDFADFADYHELADQIQPDNIGDDIGKELLDGMPNDLQDGKEAVDQVEDTGGVTTGCSVDEYGAHDLVDICQVESGKLYILTEEGEVVELSDGNFTQVAQAPGGGNAIWAVDESNIFVGSSDCLYYYDGSTWQCIIQAGYNVTDVWASAVNDVYAICGDEELIFHWDGQKSELQWEGDETYLYSIWGLDANHVYVTALNDPVLLYYNSITWQAIEPPPCLSEENECWFEFYSITGFAPDDLYIGSYRQIWHWNGSTWELVWQTEEGEVEFTSIHGVDPQHLYAISNKKIYSNSFGIWQEIFEAPVDLNGIWAIAKDKVIAVGEDGYVVKCGF